MGADVVALYPSLNAEGTQDMIKKAVLESEVAICDMDYKEATRFLAMKMSKEEVNNHKLRKVIPKRKHKNGTRPNMSSKLAKGVGDVSEDHEQWTWPRVQLNDQ